MPLVLGGPRRFEIWARGTVPVLPCHTGRCFEKVGEAIGATADF